MQRQPALRLLIGVAFAANLAISQTVRAQPGRLELVSAAQIEPLGLSRRWFNQLRVASGRGSVRNMVLAPDALVAQTDQAMIELIDADTGRSLWQAQSGSSQRPTEAPAVSKDYVAVTNGSHLYVYNRARGTLHFEQRLGGAPAAGCALGPEFVYVPLTSGAIEAYRLDRKEIVDRVPVVHFGGSVPQTAPTIGPERFYWTTRAGVVYGDGLTSLKNRFLLKTDGAVHGGATVWSPLVYAGSLDGRLYAADETQGTVQWRLPLGGAIRQRPLATADGVFVVSDGVGLARVVAKTGEFVWLAPGVARILSVSETRVYGLDASQRLLVLDAANGGLLGSLAADYFNLLVPNYQTDRLYLASTGGTLICLHEPAHTTPLVHEPKKAAPAARPARRAAEGDSPADGAMPDGAAPAEPDAANPFGS